MALEIEHKFLVRDESWRAQVTRSQRMDQGYLGSLPSGGDDLGRSSVRVRVAGDAAHLNIKSRTAGHSRLEFEYPIPLDEAEEILAQCSNLRIEKIRHWIPMGELFFEVDEFLGDNAGLVVAEIELSEVGQTFPKPAWLGREVTDDLRYYNTELARHPWTQWSDKMGDETGSGETQ